jgi:hypothetical protein
MSEPLQFIIVVGFGALCFGCTKVIGIFLCMRSYPCFSCVTIHPRARFSEVNLPKQRTGPSGRIICTRHPRGFRMGDIER